MSGDRLSEADAYRQLQREADHISSLIIASDVPAIDIVIEIQKLRDFALRYFPDKSELFKNIYESRFRRFWEQFRRDEGSLPEW